MEQLNLNNPFFTIVIPTKDRPSLLKILLESILDQDFLNFEIIVANNSLSVETNNLLKNFTDKRMVIIKNNQLNMSDNWNSGVERARGQYLLIFSDKMFLKRNALTYLYKYIKKNKADCVTWQIDKYFIDKNEFEKSRALPEIKKLTIDWLKGIFISNLVTYHVPCHCNSCISMEVVKKIINKTGKLCMQLNPDYTMGFQILLNTQYIHQIKANLAILLYPNDKKGFGNGSSMWFKTNKFSNHDQFIESNKDWYDNNNLMESSIKIKFFYVQDVILQDLYNILKIYKKIPDELMSELNRKCNYYINAYKEIILRRRGGVPLDDEIIYLKKIIGDETIVVKSKIYLKIFFLRFKLFFIEIFLILKKNNYFFLFIEIIKKYSSKNKKKSFFSIKDAYRQIDL